MNKPIVPWDLLVAMEKDMTNFAVIPKEIKDESLASVATLILNEQWKEIFRLARIGWREEFE